MAIENSDLLVAYRPGNQTHYKLSIADFPAGETLPDGTAEGQYLKWDGSDWVVSSEINEPLFVIDGGEYA